MRSNCKAQGTIHPVRPQWKIIYGRECVWLGHFFFLIAILLIALDLFLLLFFSPILVWWLSLVLYLSWFFLFVCVSIVDFWLAVILKFWYESVCINMRLFLSLYETIYEIHIYIYMRLIYIHMSLYIYIWDCFKSHIYMRLF